MRRLRVAWKQIAPYAVPALVLLAVILVMFWRLWTPLEGERRGFAWDARWEYWGDLQYQIHALGHGHFPLWNPFDRMGYPFHADPQTGTLYPLQWPLWLISFAIGSAPWWLISIKIVMHLWLGALGMYFLCRRRRLPPAACYLAGVVFLTSYPVLHNGFSAINWSFAWTPWLLLAIDAWAERPSPARGALVAGAAAMGLLAGGLPGWWYGLVVAIPWAIVEVVIAARAARRDGRGREYARAALASAGVAAGIFLALVAAQLLATRALLPHTVRSRRGVDFIGTTVFDAVDVVGFLVPRMQGENTYLGLAPILWIGALLIVRPTARNLMLGGVFVLAALCAMGDRGPVLPALASIVPPFGFFRRAHRYLYVGVIPIGVLAAEGLAYLAAVADEAVRARLRRSLAIAAGIALVVCIGGFTLRGHVPWKPDQIRDAFGYGAASALVAGWTTWMLLGGDGLWRRRFMWIAMVAAGLDLWVCRTADVEKSLDAIPVTHHDQLARAPDLPLAHRIYDRGFLAFRPGTRLGVRDFGGYEGDPLALSRYEALHEAILRAPRDMAYAGVAHYFETGGTTIRKSRQDLDVMKPAGRGAWTVDGAAPAVAWYDTAELAGDAHAALKATLAAGPGAKAVLEAPALDAGERARAAKVDAPATPRVDGTLDALGGDELRATVDAPADGVVVVNEMYYPSGWRAWVDGKPAAIVPADGFARAVFVGPGRHTIVMRYEAGGFVWLAALMPLGLIGIGVLVWRERRRGEGDAPPDGDAADDGGADDGDADDGGADDDGADDGDADDGEPDADRDAGGGEPA